MILAMSINTLSGVSIIVKEVDIYCTKMCKKSVKFIEQERNKV